MTMRTDRSLRQCYGRATVQACLILMLMTASNASRAEGSIAYRCTLAGRTAYQSTPCAGGTRINSADPRTEAQRDQAQTAAQRQAVAADQLQTANLARAQALDRQGRRSSDRVATADGRQGSHTKHQVKGSTVDARAKKPPAVFTVKIPAVRAGKSSQEPAKENPSRAKGSD